MTALFCEKQNYFPLRNCGKGYFAFFVAYTWNIFELKN